MDSSFGSTWHEFHIESRIMLENTFVLNIKALHLNRCWLNTNLWNKLVHFLPTFILYEVVVLMHKGSFIVSFFGGNLIILARHMCLVTLAHTKDSNFSLPILFTDLPVLRPSSHPNSIPIWKQHNVNEVEALVELAFIFFHVDAFILLFIPKSKEVCKWSKNLCCNIWFCDCRRLVGCERVAIVLSNWQVCHDTYQIFLIIFILARLPFQCLDVFWRCLSILVEGDSAYCCTSMRR